MDNKKVPTLIGASILVIIAITVGMFVWRYERGYDNALDTQKITAPIVGDIQAQPKKNVTSLSEEDIKNEWKIYQNEKYRFKMTYPPSFLFNENLYQDPTIVYSIQFGPAYERVFGTKNPYSQTKGVFSISIFKNNEKIDAFIKEGNFARGAVEQSSESVGAEKVSGTQGKVIKTCDMGGYCSKIIYLVQGQYIYTIYMENYFATEEAELKQALDRMVTNLRFY